MATKIRQCDLTAYFEITVYGDDVLQKIVMHSSYAPGQSSSHITATKLPLSSSFGWHSNSKRWAAEALRLVQNLDCVKKEGEPNRPASPTTKPGRGQG